jgi:hypothetical protein
MVSTPFSQANALTALMTAESLLFAVFAVTLSIGAGPTAKQADMRFVRRLAVAAAAVLTLLGIGGLISWCDLFVAEWPGRLAEWAPLVALAVGIVAQPVFAWAIAYYMTRRPRSVYGR